MGKAGAVVSEACVTADAVVLTVDEAVVPRPNGATFVSSAASEGCVRLGLEVILRPIRNAALVGGRPTEDISSLTLSSEATMALGPSPISGENIVVAAMATPRPHALSQAARPYTLTLRAVGNAAPIAVKVRTTNASAHVLAGLEA